ncbi:AraC family transcriptional regulator [Actinopolymorpha singaporensis]
MVQGWSRYLTPTPVQRRLGLVCLGAGQKQELDPCPPRILRSHAAVLVVDGQGWLESGESGRRSAITAGSLFWLFPGVRHSYGPDGRGWEEIWMLFEGPAVDAYEELGYLSRDEPLIPLVDLFPARSAMDRVLAACRQQHAGAEVEAAHAVHALILAVQNRRDDRADGAVLATLREGACEPWSVAEHARRAGVPVSALRQVVRRHGGCSPKEYLLRIRLNRAKELLAESDLTVAEIGRLVGHDDPAYFSRLFTRRTGMAPRDFRTQERRPRSS